MEEEEPILCAGFRVRLGAVVVAWEALVTGNGAMVFIVLMGFSSLLSVRYHDTYIYTSGGRDRDR